MYKPGLQMFKTIFHVTHITSCHGNSKVTGLTGPLDYNEETERIPVIKCPSGPCPSVTMVCIGFSERPRPTLQILLRLDEIGAFRRGLGEDACSNSHLSSSKRTRHLEGMIRRPDFY